MKTYSRRTHSLKTDTIKHDRHSFLLNLLLKESQVVGKILFFAEVLLELGLIVHRLNYTLGRRQDRPLIRLIVIISSPDLIRRRTERIDRQDMVNNVICEGVKTI